MTPFRRSQKKPVELSSDLLILQISGSNNLAPIDLSSAGRTTVQTASGGFSQWKSK